MPRLTCFAVVLVALACGALQVPYMRTLAVAQDDTAGQRAAGEALLQAGKAAYDAGHFSDAQRDFEQALARLGRPTIHYDIGQAAERAGDNTRALAAFRDYLSALPNAPNRAEVEARIDLLQTALSEPQPADLSPTAAAETQLGGSGVLERPASARDGSDLWWLWAGIGAVVVGTVVAALIVSTSDDPTQPPLRGDVGRTIETLEVR